MRNFTYNENPYFLYYCPDFLFKNKREIQRLNYRLPNSILNAANTSNP